MQEREERVVIGIPCYEALDTLLYSLGSIVQQVYVSKISVILSFDNDPTEKETIDFIEKNYKPLLPRIYYISGDKQLGPGGNRNRILKAVYDKDFGEFDYLAFLDQDDSLWSVLAIGQMVYPFSEDNTYAATCGNVITSFEDGSLKDLKNDHQTWLHGKLFNINFLKKFHLFFPLSTSEDMAFCNEVTWFSNNHQYYYPEPICFWRFNKKSLTRDENSGYLKEGLCGFIESKLFVFEKIKEEYGLEVAKIYGLSTLPFLYNLTAEMLLNTESVKEANKGSFFIARFIYETEAVNYIHTKDRYHTYLYEGLDSDYVKEFRGSIKEIPFSYEEWLETYANYKPFLEVLEKNVRDNNSSI